MGRIPFHGDTDFFLNEAYNLVLEGYNYDKVIQNDKDGHIVYAGSPIDNTIGFIFNDTLKFLTHKDINTANDILVVTDGDFGLKEISQTGIPYSTSGVLSFLDLEKYFGTPSDNGVPTTKYLLDNYVPYTGAIKDITLGNYGIQAGSLSVDSNVQFSGLSDLAGDFITIDASGNVSFRTPEETRLDINALSQADVYWNITDGSTTSQISNNGTLTLQKGLHTILTLSGSTMTIEAVQLTNDEVISMLLNGYQIETAKYDLLSSDSILKAFEKLEYRVVQNEQKVTMTYPDAGIALSTGTAWGASIPDNHLNWDDAYSKRIDSLTTTGVSGPATFINNVLNIPQYTYTHPSYTAISETLSGATVLNVIESDTTGHITNIQTRTLTYTDIGAQVAGDYQAHSTDLDVIAAMTGDGYLRHTTGWSLDNVIGNDYLNKAKSINTETSTDAWTEYVISDGGVIENGGLYQDIYVTNDLYGLSVYNERYFDVYNGIVNLKQDLDILSSITARKVYGDIYGNIGIFGGLTGTFSDSLVSDTILATKAIKSQQYLELSQYALVGGPTSGLGWLYAGTDGKVYFVNDAGTTFDLTASQGIADAPADGNIYARQDSAWVSITSSGGSTFTSWLLSVGGTNYTVDSTNNTVQFSSATDAATSALSITEDVSVSTIYNTVFKLDQNLDLIAALTGEGLLRKTAFGWVVDTNNYVTGTFDNYQNWVLKVGLAGQNITDTGQVVSSLGSINLLQGNDAVTIVRDTNNITFTHTATGVTDSNNTDNTVIQNISFDAYGHVAGYTTKDLVQTNPSNALIKFLSSSGLSITTDDTVDTVPEFTLNQSSPETFTFTLSDELIAISALSGSGFLKRVSAGSWIIDTNTYLTGNETITITGDVTGSGSTAITLTLADVNTDVGTFNNVTVNSKGLITAASNINYLTTETDPVFTASAAYGIASADITNWNTAFGWGDHSLVGYLTSETDPVFSASPAGSIAQTDIDNWNTAFGWGNWNGGLNISRIPYFNGTNLVDSPMWLNSASTISDVNFDAGISASGSIYGDGNIETGSQFVTNQTTLAPFQVASTIHVPNLNVDLLDGHHWGDVFTDTENGMVPTPNEDTTVTNNKYLKENATWEQISYSEIVGTPYISNEPINIVVTGALTGGGTFTLNQSVIADITLGLNQNLTDIANLSGSGLLSKDGTGAWYFDTNAYLITVGNLDTSSATSLVPGTENFSGDISLHKISKTGDYSDLVNIPTSFPSAPHLLGSHSDVSITTPAQGEVLTFDGTNWINSADYAHPSYTAISLTLASNEIISTLKTDTIGSVTEATTRVLSYSDIGAQQQNANLDSISAITGYGYLENTATGWVVVNPANTYLPYTGALNDVDIGTHTFSAKQINVYDTSNIYHLQVTGESYFNLDNDMIFQVYDSNQTYISCAIDTLTLEPRVLIGTNFYLDSLTELNGDFVTITSDGKVHSRTAANVLLDINAQPKDADLTSIAGIADTDIGFLKKGGAGNWFIDSNTYLTSVGTLDTTTTTTLTSGSESFLNTIYLHKISKSGSYLDLLDKPVISDSTITFSTTSTALSVNDTFTLNQQTDKDIQIVLDVNLDAIASLTGDGFVHRTATGWSVDSIIDNSYLNKSSSFNTETSTGAWEQYVISDGGTIENLGLYQDIYVSDSDYGLSVYNEKYFDVYNGIVNLRQDLSILKSIYAPEVKSDKITSSRAVYGSILDTFSASVEVDTQRVSETLKIDNIIEFTETTVSGTAPTGKGWLYAENGKIYYNNYDLTAAGLGDAPQDTLIYGRKDGAWVLVPSADQIYSYWNVTDGSTVYNINDSDNVLFSTTGNGLNVAISTDAASPETVTIDFSLASDLNTISGLNTGEGFLRRRTDNTWYLDTTQYLTGTYDNYVNWNLLVNSGTANAITSGANFNLLNGDFITISNAGTDVTISHNKVTQTNSTVASTTVLNDVIVDAWGHITGKVTTTIVNANDPTITLSGSTGITISDPVSSTNTFTLNQIDDKSFDFVLASNLQGIAQLTGYGFVELRQDGTWQFNNAVVGNLDTTASTVQTPAIESFTGNIILHKISKTGDYNDLLNTPVIGNATITLSTDGRALTGGGSFTLNSATDTTISFSLNDNLDLISELTGGGLLKRNVDDTWTLDTTSYLSSVGTLDTTSTTSLTFGTESFLDAIQLHRVSKTGLYNDLIGLPDLTPQKALSFDPEASVQAYRDYIISDGGEENGLAGYLEIYIDDYHWGVSTYNSEHFNVSNGIVQLKDFPSYNITSTQISNWDTAYTWGDHSTFGYIKSLIEDLTPQLGGDLDGQFFNISTTGNITASNLNITNWDTAYGWGDHSQAGYAILSAANIFTADNTFNGNIIIDATKEILLGNGAISDTGTAIAIGYIGQPILNIEEYTVTIGGDLKSDRYLYNTLGIAIGTSVSTYSYGLFLTGFANQIKIQTAANDPVLDIATDFASGYVKIGDITQASSGLLYTQDFASNIHLFDGNVLFNDFVTINSLTANNLILDDGSQQTDALLSCSDGQSGQSIWKPITEVKKADITLTKPTTGFTIDATMGEKTISCDFLSDDTVTLTDVLNDGEWIDFIQWGSGKITFTTDGSMGLMSIYTNNQTIGQGSKVRIMRVDLNWVVTGDLT